MDFDEKELKVAQEQYDKFGRNIQYVLMRRLKITYPYAKYLAEYIDRINSPRGYT